MNALERSSRRTVEFAHPFSLANTDTEFPPGRYEIEAEEELIPGLSFIAYRRVRTTMETPPAAQGIAIQRQLLTIDPVALEAAITRDKEQSLRPTGTHADPTPKASTMTPQSQKTQTSGERTPSPERGAPQFQKHNLISSAPVLIPMLIVAGLVLITWYRPAPRTVAPVDAPASSVQSPAR